MAHTFIISHETQNIIGLLVTRMIITEIHNDISKPDAVFTLFNYNGFLFIF